MIFNLLNISEKVRCFILNKLNKSRFILNVMIFSLVVIFFLYSVPSPRTMIYFSGVSESIEITVASHNVAQIRLSAARDPVTDVCMDNFWIIPDQGAQITYRFDPFDALRVFVDGSVVVLEEGSNKSRKVTELRLVFDPKDEECDPGPFLRLPANGIIKFGRQFVNSGSADNHWSLLRTGHLYVYGHTSESIFYLVPLNWGPFRSNALYLVESFELPGGTQLAYSVDRKRHPVQWRGYVDISFGDAEGGMKVSTTTNATAVGIYPPIPGAAKATSSCVPLDVEGVKPECISVDLAAQVFGDPNLSRVFAIVSAVGALLALRSAVSTKSD